MHAMCCGLVLCFMECSGNLFFIVIIIIIIIIIKVLLVYKVIRYLFIDIFNADILVIISWWCVFNAV